MAFTSTRSRPSTSAPGDGSRTITLRDDQPREEGSEGDSSHEPSHSEVGRLTLRGGRSRPRVVWSEDTVDNEGAGKKSSKICCVYHKPKRFDESSSDESSESESDSSCGGHNHSHGGARRRKRRHHQHRAEGESGGDATKSREGEGAVVHELSSDEEEVNRYERGPGKAKKGKGAARE
ncbi:phosphatase inhibitor-domain-containing protein [Cristinia sonorae]|uniref:Type 1 phosphatases regulator n=1 Tax=Cristinia sonorae TaxID=1940300 RepID=A0A8K0UE09_9AGAR|nr:phosphatase inhibitor-domain-containing protein [Cristinia sonorae]